MSRVSVFIDRIEDESRRAYHVAIGSRSYWVPKALSRIVNYKRKIEVESWFVRRVMQIDTPPKPTFSIERLRQEHAASGCDYTPCGFYRHQEYAYRKLRDSKVFALFMECRSGKTKVAIELVTTHLKSSVIDNVIWLCPVSVLETARWQWERFSTLRDWKERVCFFGLETASGCRLERFAELADLARSRKCALIVDESHMIKNSNAKRSKRIDRFAGKCPVRGLLSGTPVTRNIEDVYNQAAFLDWRILGYRNLYQFQQNHLVMDDHIPGLVRDTRNTGFIAERLDPFVYEYFPESTGSDCHETIFCDVSDEQREWYDRIKHRMIERLERCTNETHDIYLLFTALQSVLAGHVSERVVERIFGEGGPVFLEPPKLQCFLAARSDIDDKAVVWCTRRHEVEILRTALPESFVVDGLVTPSERHGIIQRFRRSTRGTLIAMMPVAKRGIDISECDHAFFFGQSFDYESREQAEARIVLPGKGRPCHFYDMIYRNSLDERILLSHARKSNIIKEFLDKFKCDSPSALESARQL